MSELALLFCAEPTGICFRLLSLTLYWVVPAFIAMDLLGAMFTRKPASKGRRKS